MPIRDLALVVIVVGALPVCLVRPYIGVLLWSWLGFMNPHRLTWGFAYDLPFAQLVAVATVLGLIFTRDRRPIPRIPESALLLGFWVVVTLSTVFAMFPDRAVRDLEQFSKVLFMSFVSILLCQERARLRLLLLVAALSIGFYGIKGGLFGILTGGAHMVFGPPGSFIGDNNGLGLALNMTLPFLFFMPSDESRRWLRWVLYGGFGLTVLSVLLTYSRGNFLGLVVVLLLIVLKTRWKRVAIPAGFVGAVVALWFLPEKWFDRISTISDYESDLSAMGRIYAWRIAWTIALENPFLGGGFRVFGPEIWHRFMPELRNWANVHSIYFQVLAEHGFIGMGVFAALVTCTLLTLRRLRRQWRGRTEGAWIVNYSQMIETSMLGFLVAGAFQNLAYFDFFWFLIGVTIVLRALAREAATEPARSPADTAPARTVTEPPRVPVVWSPTR
jgi:probable O-glycosylation ligase (exosortase A-associated)